MAEVCAASVTTCLDGMWCQMTVFWATGRRLLVFYLQTFCGRPGSRHYFGPGFQCFWIVTATADGVHSNRRARSRGSLLFS